MQGPLILRIFLFILFNIYFLTPAFALVRRFNYDASLFEYTEEDSRSVMYSRSNKDDWKNLTKLANSRNIPWYTLVCTMGGGSWLAYPSEDFLIKDNPFYTFINGEQCMSTEWIKSMQPIGDMSKPLDQGLVVFPQDNFQGKQITLASGKGHSGPTGSLIYAGGLAYTIGSGNDAVCLMPVSPGLNYAPCLIPNLDSLGLKSVSSIKEGCDAGAQLKVISPTNCYEEGTHRIFANRDFSFKQMTDVCGKGKADEKTNSKFNLIMEIWKGRISHGLESMESIKFPYEATYKQKVLDEIISVFHSTCPIVPPEYLSILKNVFLMHLRTAWKLKPRLIGVEDDYWRHSLLFLDSCSKNVQGPSANDDVNCLPEETDGDEDDPESDAFSDLLSGDQYDPIIEQMWLIVNQVTPYCNLVNEYKTNDWTNMVSMFRRNFFDPISNQWFMPGPWRTIYSTMFHGFNTQQMRYRILSCVQRSLSQTPHYDPIGRTRFFYRKEQERYEVISKMMDLGAYGGDKTKSGGPLNEEATQKDDGAAETDNADAPTEKPGKKLKKTKGGGKSITVPIVSSKKKRQQEE